MHLSSFEFRWFWNGSLDQNPTLKAAFENVSVVAKRSDVTTVRWGKSRDDVYLVIPSADDLGVKWREGELQTKGRRALLGSVAFGRGVHGAVEQWTKWSHEGPVVDAALKPLFSSAALKTAVTVTKRRALRKVRLDPMGAGQEVPESEHIDRGVNCELTDIGVNGVSYYSLAFEAFPDDPEMPEQFSKLVSNFLTAFDPAAFAGIQSLSYPAWLDQIAQASHV